MSAQDTKRGRLFLICTPRSGSTSLLKCLSFVDKEADVWFEPFIFAHIARLEFKKHTGKELPTNWTQGCDVDFEQVADLLHTFKKYPRVAGKNHAYSEIKHAIENPRSGMVIVKDVGKYLDGFLQFLPSPNSGFRYVFLIRDPYHAIPSYKRAHYSWWKTAGPGRGEDKDLRDFDLYRDSPQCQYGEDFYKSVHTVWTYVCENLEHNPLVIDFADLISNPEPFLQKICEVGGFNYRDGLLEWDASPDISASWRTPAGVDLPQLFSNSLAGYHTKAMASTCFMAHKVVGKERPSVDGLGEDVPKAIAEGIVHYTKLHEHRFIPN